jgi:hypothetical protein
MEAWQKVQNRKREKRMTTTYYIVQLEHNVWLAPWDSDPGRTENIENAQRFPLRQAAEKALKRARQYRPFREAFVDKLKATVI